jgi:hypothetical protein
VATVATAGDAHNSSNATMCAQSNESDEQLTSSTSDSSSHSGEHVTTVAVVDADITCTVAADDTHEEHTSPVIVAAAEPEATPEHSSTELATQQHCNSVDEANVTVTGGSCDKAATDSTAATTNTNSVSAATAETSETPVAVFQSGSLSVSAISGHNLQAAIFDTAAAAVDTDADVDTTATAVQLYLTIELGEQEQSTGDISVTLDTASDAATAIVWPDSCISFTVGTSTELLQGLTVKLWDDSGSTLAKGSIAAHTLQTLCFSAASGNDTAAVADHSMLDVVVVMQAPASKPRWATASAAATATATAISCEQLLTQMSVSCCLSYTAGAVAAATSGSEAVVVEAEVQDADMQDMLFDTARSGSADDSAGSNHSAELFEEDEPEVNASVSIQDNTAAAIDNSGNSHPQQSSTEAVSDANSSNGVGDEDLYMSQMVDDDDTEQ